jgi:capsular polysaccharide biosynthesis protein
MDWLEIIVGICKFLYILFITIIVVLVFAYILAVISDTHTKVTKIYEMVVQQDTTENKSQDEINVTCGFYE